ncbi:TetR/AcrR family transcriptional regulator [Streptomyces sp. NPDC049585]|uniref:TetR/AcrR family transcriptional regulator n=1 Tax=Streptomyces sp. NPDC049585 TaxID=3155154 RepID=UPI0034205F49
MKRKRAGMAGGSRADAGSMRTSVWLADKQDGAPKRRSGGQSGEGALDRERIVAATVRLLDAEGFAKFSMRRLAAELGVTAMSVYWYVDTKDDLLELAIDEVWGEIALPDPAEETADWRDQLRDLVSQYRRTLVAHTWLPQLLGQYLNIGPRAMTFANTSLAVIRRSGVAPHALTGAISAVFQFAYGFAATQGLYMERCRAAGVGEDEYYAHVMQVVTERTDFTEQYREAAELVEARGERTVAQMWEHDFGMGLETVIAGIEVLRDRAQ